MSLDVAGIKVLSNATRYDAAYVYPARIFISEDFPAPLGPIIAVKWPEHKRPEIRFSIVLKPTTTHKLHNFLPSFINCIVK